MQHAGSAGASRAGKNQDVLLLQSTVEALKQELHYSRVEIGRVSDQLNCLIMLVKKAWTGDKTAAVHVANIVGVAPPDIKEDCTEEATITLTAKPKSRGLNNWAILTIGLLNRAYRQEERDMEDRRQRHLELRVAYLEEQLIQHRDTQLRLQPPPVPQRHNSPVELHDLEDRDDPDNCLFITQGRRSSTGAIRKSPNKISVTRPPSGVKCRKPQTKHLYRPPSQEHNGMMVGDLVCEPIRAASKVTHDADKVFDGLYQLSHTATEHPASMKDEAEDADQMYMPYDDPHRYAMFGLFDKETVGQHHPRVRPVSAKQQHTADSIRSRPKSAVTAKGERPLKFETTRPLSGKASGHARRVQSAKERLVHNNSTSQPKNTNRPQSGKTFITSDMLSNGTLDVSSTSDGTNQKPGSNSSRLGRPHTAFGSNTSLNTDRREASREAEALRAYIQKPASVIEYEEDVLAMNDMEREFKKTAIELQKKLGISPKGIVY